MKKLLAIIFVLCLTAGCLCGCGGDEPTADPGAGATSDFDSATNLKESLYGISYEVPAAWELDTVASTTSSKNYSSNDCTLMVSCDEREVSLSITDSEFTDALVEYHSTYPYTVQSHGLSVINGLDCLRIDGSLNADGVEEPLYCTYFFVDSHMYTVTLLNSNPAVDYSQDYEKVLGSIEVVAGQAPAETPAEVPTGSSSTPAGTSTPASTSAPTLGESNALGSAQSYLRYMAFSYSGLIRQLEFEGYTTAEATYAADNCGADWNEQAVKSAQTYLTYMSFSKSELINQLEFEGFSSEQANYAATQVGY